MTEKFKDIIVYQTSSYIFRHQNLKIKSFYDIETEDKKLIFKHAILQYCNNRNFDEIFSSKSILYDYGRVYSLSKIEVTSIIYANIKKELHKQVAKKLSSFSSFLYLTMVFVVGLTLGFLSGQIWTLW